MKQMTLSILCLLFFLPAFASRTSFPSQLVEIQEGDRLMIKGFVGSLKLRTVTKGKELRVSGRKTNPKLNEGESLELNAWNLNVTKNGKVVLVEVTVPQEKTFWESYKQREKDKRIPKIDLLVSTPSIPTEVSWRSGKIEVQAWQGPLSVSMEDGQVVAQSMKGDLNLQITQGLAKMIQHEGRMTIDSYSADIEAVSSVGTIDFNNFSGKTIVKKHEGNLDYRSFSGRSEIAGIKGSTSFSIKRGSLVAKALDGRVRGKSASGQVDVQLTGDEVDANISSDDGTVTVRPPKNSSAHVRLKTKEGDLAGPRSLKFQSLVTGKYLVGNLRGSKPGRLRVSSESGNIRLR